MAVIAFPMGIFGKRLLLAGKGALKKKKTEQSIARMGGFEPLDLNREELYKKWKQACPKGLKYVYIYTYTYTYIYIYIY